MTNVVTTTTQPKAAPAVDAGRTPPPGSSETTASWLIGLPRSGTTLLSYLLGGGDSQLSLSEPYLAFDILGRWRRPVFFNRLARKAGLRPIPVPRGNSDAELAAYIVNLAAANGLRHAVVKETYREGHDWENARLLSRIAKQTDAIIAIHRHPYDIAVSSIRFCKWWRGIPGRLIRLWIPRLPLFESDRHVAEHVADNWRSFFHWCRTHEIAAIRYEDLVSRPEEELRKACEACRIPFQPQMLDHTHPRGAFGGIGAPEIMNRPPRPVNTQSVGRKKLLPPEFWAVITDRCGNEAAQMGYEM